MNGPTRAVLMCFALAAAASCSPGSDEPGSDNKRPKEPPPIKDTVFKDTVVTPLDKARSVEGTVLQQKQDADKAIDAETR